MLTLLWLHFFLLVLYSFSVERVVPAWEAKIETAFVLQSPKQMQQKKNRQDSTTSPASHFVSSSVNTPESTPSPLLPSFHRSSCPVHFLPCDGLGRPDTAVACLHVKFQLGESLSEAATWAMNRRPVHMSTPAGPVASVKSVSSAAPRVSDPNPPRSPATTSPAPNPQTTPPQLPNMSSSAPPPSPWALYASLDLSHCTSVQNGRCLALWPTDWLRCLSRSKYQDTAEADGPILLFSLVTLRFNFTLLKRARVCKNQSVDPHCFAI